MIRIKCGTCGTSKGYKTQADGAFSLPISEGGAPCLSRRGGLRDHAIIGANPGIATPTAARTAEGVVTPTTWQARTRPR